MVDLKSVPAMQRQTGKVPSFAYGRCLLIIKSGAEKEDVRSVLVCDRYLL